MNKSLLTKHKLIESYFNALKVNNATILTDLFSPNAMMSRPNQAFDYPYTLIGKDKINQYWNKIFSEYNISDLTIKEIEKVNERNTYIIKHVTNIKTLNKPIESKTLSFTSLVFDSDNKIEKFVEIFYPLTKIKI
ncbi:hypothetical protein LG651_00150 [Tamlana sp. 62-3]|uniref:SnoaL-like domain-containing protein n=1 Tax=Neotamlana sargassicola TaxID=2883125 RepID=A0A9X1I2V7_9FLAO|nr:hypothetical protein [Tamlana sargassicola]MCB4806642.1 hypothetical protein [Tamlana sargassicola]